MSVEAMRVRLFQTIHAIGYTCIQEGRVYHGMCHDVDGLNRDRRTVSFTHRACHISLCTCIKHVSLNLMSWFSHM